MDYLFRKTDREADMGSECGCRTDGFPALRDDDSQRSWFTGSTPKAYRCRDQRAACHFVPDAPAPNNPAAELAASRP
jgi:hypothetical protein